MDAIKMNRVSAGSTVPIPREKMTIQKVNDRGLDADAAIRNARKSNNTTDAESRTLYESREQVAKNYRAREKNGWTDAERRAQYEDETALINQANAAIEGPENGIDLTDPNMAISTTASQVDVIMNRLNP
jgi:post-segregation antitoxin (ccd killing protein)